MIKNQKTPEYLDTHLHLIYQKKFDYSWTKDIPVLANKDFTIEDYWSSAAKSNVSKAIFMESAADDEFWQDETRFVLKLMSQTENKLAGIVASCRPELGEKQFDAWLEETQGQQVVGYRRILHVFSDDMSQMALFRRNIQKIGAQNKTFDLCVLEKQLPIAIKLAEACDNTKMVLNHCGIPDIQAGNIKYWQEHITRLAKLPNVFCKISGVIAYCSSGEATSETLKPYIEHCIESFGWQRLIWGSDWPVCNLALGLSHWSDVFQQLIKQESQGVQQDIAYNNAKSFYNLR